MESSWFVMLCGRCKAHIFDEVEVEELSTESIANDRRGACDLCERPAEQADCHYVRREDIWKHIDRSEVTKEIIEKEYVPALHAYLSLAFTLERRISAGKGEGEKSGAVRSQMAMVWETLSGEERELCEHFCAFG